MTTIQVDVSNNIATITLLRPRTLNALTLEDYDAFATALRTIDKREDVLVTVWQATGKWFCAGTDVRNRVPEELPDNVDPVRSHFRSRVTGTTTDCSQALYAHSKILVAALNGPVMGIAAALLGQFDFIYAMPNVWLSVPFAFLGIVAEGGSSVTFVNRMGVAKANEALIWGKKQTVEQLLACGFVNQIFPLQTDQEFHKTIRTHLESELEGLDGGALLGAKKLLRAGLSEKNNPDAVNLRESYAQAERFATDIPARQFLRIATREIKHKL